MPEEDAVSLIRQTMFENPILITRFVSMLSHRKNTTAFVHATYLYCRNRYLSSRKLECNNPLAVVLHMAERVVRGNLQVPAQVPARFEEHFTVGRTPQEKEGWRRLEALVHDYVEERLWPTAALLLHSGVRYDFHSAESREMTKLWSSQLGISNARVRKNIDDVRRQIDRRREDHVDAQ